MPKAQRKSSQEAEEFGLSVVINPEEARDHVNVARWTYSDLMVILGSPRVTFYTGYTFDFNVNISSMYHLKT